MAVWTAWVAAFRDAVRSECSVAAAVAAVAQRVAISCCSRTFVSAD